MVDHMILLIGLLLLLLLSHQTNAQNCSLRSGEYIYDLSPLSKSSGAAYEAEGSNGDGFYYFNICGEVSQGACSPHQSVCQVGDAPHGCGDARHVVLEAMPNNAGVRLNYSNGEPCYVRGGWLRKVTINVFCDPNATTLRVKEAREDPQCIYEIDAYSVHGCPTRVPETVSPDVPVNIFLVVHSHDDVGWIKTMQGYYDDQVTHIIDNIVDELLKNETRKFIQVEQAFFVKWWKTASDTRKQEVTKLVRNGQLKFPIGGWVMPDEALPSYSSLITQLTEGHQFLKRTFNYTPDVGWQIDPFGASTVLAEIHKLSNFKGHVIDRIDWRVKNDLLVNKSLQFQWQVSNNSNILTHVLDVLYCFPFLKGMQYRYELDDAEVVSQSIYAVNVAKDKARWTRTPNVLIPVGCDFAYSAPDLASHQYKALDKIIDYVTKNKDSLNVIGIQYSTIDDYFDALHNSGTEFPVYSGDFFPYEDKDNSWWTGYFTSRPALKGLIRKSEAVLRASEFLFSTANMVSNYDSNSTRSDIESLLHAVSINLHHDAITGTAMPVVVQDYTQMLDSGLEKNHRGIELMLAMLSDKAEHHSILNFTDSAYANNILTAVVYNSLPWHRHDYVQLTLNNYNSSKQYFVTCNEYAVNSQVIANFSGSENSVLFFKVELPPLGYQTYYIKEDEKIENNEKKLTDAIKNDFLQIKFAEDKTISGVESNGLNIDIVQKFLMYRSYTGAGQQSGAYIFRPDLSAPPFGLSLSPNTNFSQGEFVSDVYQEFSYSESPGPVVTQHARMYHDKDEFLGNFLELSHRIGPLPHADNGREFTARFDTSLDNNRTCFTDSNGFRFLERTYNPNMFLPIAGNHYPTVYASYFSDANHAIGFIWDRPHGFSCSYGTAEVMLHRRCTQDDARGLQLPLDDELPIDPVMRIVFGSPSEILNLVYRQMYLLNFRPIVTIGAAESEEAWKSTHLTEFSLLYKPLPPNVHIVDLKLMEASAEKGQKFLMRLTHLFDKGEHKTLADTVELNMRDFFAEPYCITSLFETQLTANQVKEVIHINQDEPPVISLLPKQIKTFLLDIEEDGDNCANHQCGKAGKCIDLKCTYTCKCDHGSVFDPIKKTCVSISDHKSTPGSHQSGSESQFSFWDDLFLLSSAFPFAITSYLSFVCAYGIRAELAKISSIERNERTKEITETKDWKSRFLEANVRVVENFSFPLFGSLAPRDISRL